MKNERMRDGMENPSEYNTMYNIAESGFVLPSVITAIKIGPIHGVHPDTKAIPIKIDPIYTPVQFLNLYSRSFISKLLFKIPSTTRPKNIIKMAPIWRIKS